MKNKNEIWAESLIDSIGQVKKQKPSDLLFQKVLERLDESKQNISFKWVSLAAVLIIGLFIGEFLVVNQQVEVQSELLEIIPESNNTLYHE